MLKTGHLVQDTGVTIHRELQVNNDLQRLQALMLDVAAPLLQLMSIMEEDADILPRHPGGGGGGEDGT